MANRTKWTAKKRDEFLSIVADGHSITYAARLVGMSRSRVYAIREVDAEFAEALEQAVQEGSEALEDVALSRAIEGSDTLLMFLLKGRMPEKYKDRVQQDTNVSGDIKIIVEYADA